VGPVIVQEPDIARLAQLHVSCMNDSLVGVLGQSYVQSFYRYLTQSDKEFVVVERDQANHIHGAAVLSLEPATLNRRLSRQTPLLLSVVRRVHRVLAMLLSSARRSRTSSARGPAHVRSSCPELILIFIAPEKRSTGLGSALVRQVERRLHELGVPAYEVRTIAARSNPALSFYRGRAFTPAGISFRLGTPFQVFTRSLREHPPES
jgi:GNAT superfamily N-acetyltransferase